MNARNARVRLSDRTCVGERRHVLTPGRYVGAEAAKLDAAIASNLKELGYGG
ncbi:MAG: hypothetical protein IPI06_12255 [Gammaproteobacteria bacterium]|nr:hypothetical protein [Gammaproteobacteria bacterium]